MIGSLENTEHSWTFDVPGAECDVLHGYKYLSNNGEAWCVVLDLSGAAFPEDWL